MSLNVSSLLRCKINVFNNEIRMRSISTIVGAKDRNRNRSSAGAIINQLLLYKELQQPVCATFLFYTPYRNFHILTTHGILFEALQKHEFPPHLRDIKIPEELKKIKAGSLKWLFDFWPTSDIKKLPKSISDAFINQDDFDKSPKKSRRPKRNDEEQLHQMVDYLKGKNFAIRRLIKLPWLLTADPIAVEGSVKRVQKILSLSEFNIAISFINFSPEKLLQTAKFWANETSELSNCQCRVCQSSKVAALLKNRIDYIAHLLQCPKEDVSDMMTRVDGILLTMPLNHMESLITCLLEGGVKSEAILNDPWIFRNCSSTLQNRMRILNSNGITDFKPWILRKPQIVFEKFIEKQCKEMELQGGKNKDMCAFLQRKLNCTEHEAKVVMKRVKSLHYTSVTKANTTIQFLLSVGFTTDQILTSPRVFAHKVETISSRWEELRSASSTANISINLLCRPANSYRAYLRRIKLEAEKRKDDQIENLK